MYSATNNLVFDLTDKNKKHQINKHFVPYNCNGCLIAPLTNYVHNRIFQELPSKEEIFSATDTRAYIDVRDSKGYTGELQKLRRDDSNIVLYFLTITATNKK